MIYDKVFPEKMSKTVGENFYSVVGANSKEEVHRLILAQQFVIYFVTIIEYTHSISIYQAICLHMF